MVSAVQGSHTFSAQSMAQMKEKMFQRLDPDGDGQINLADLQANSSRDARLVERLTEADTNNDGIISRDEFDAMKPPDPPSKPPSEEMLAEMKDKLFEELDSDGDGKINLADLLQSEDSAKSSASHLQDLYDMLSTADADGDGFVSREEFDSMQPPPRPDENSLSTSGATYSQLQAESSRVDLVGSLLDQLG